MLCEEELEKQQQQWWQRLFSLEYKWEFDGIKIYIEWEILNVQK